MWHFYQGLRGEWQWYRFDEAGELVQTSDRGFTELTACMANAAAFGFAEGNYQVHTRDGAEETSALLAFAGRMTARPVDDGRSRSVFAEGERDRVVENDGAA